MSPETGIGRFSGWVLDARDVRGYRIGNERGVIVKSDALTQLEAPGQPIFRLFPRFRQGRDDIEIGIECDQVVIDRIDRLIPGGVALRIDGIERRDRGTLRIDERTGRILLRGGNAAKRPGKRYGSERNAGALEQRSPAGMKLVFSHYVVTSCRKRLSKPPLGNPGPNAPAVPTAEAKTSTAKA